MPQNVPTRGVRDYRGWGNIVQITRRRMANLSMPVYSTATVVTATPAQVGATGARRLMGAVMYCAANGICEFKNAATDTGTVLLTIAGLAGTTVSVDLTTVGGIAFSTAIFAKPTGTGNVVYVWFE